MSVPVGQAFSFRARKRPVEDLCRARRCGAAGQVSGQAAALAAGTSATTMSWRASSAFSFGSTTAPKNLRSFTKSTKVNWMPSMPVSTMSSASRAAIVSGDPMTGVPETKKTAYYKNAADAAEAVMAMEGKGIFQLLPKYSDVFYTKNNKEIILGFNYVRPSLTHTIDRDFSPPSDIPTYGAMGVPTAELADAFEMADGRKFSWNDPTMTANPYSGRESRFYATILYNGASWKGREINTATGFEGYVDYGTQTEPKKTVTGYYIRKYLDSTNTDALRNASDQQYIDIRYAEILLIYAEAAAKTGQFGKGKSALDKVRKRAGLPESKAKNEEELMAAVEHERIVELAFEGHRYWDLRRWRKAHIVLDNMRVHGHKPVADGKGGFTYQLVDSDKQNRYFASNTYYIPLPVAEIVNNPKLTQIQGW